MPKTTTREQLDLMGCATPNCGHDHSVCFFHARCHPYASLQVRYEKPTGHCVVICASCRKEVVRLEVA